MKADVNNKQHLHEMLLINSIIPLGDKMGAVRGLPLLLFLYSLCCLRPV